ncbi:MAG: hypothetical protein LBQ93_11515 [Treponema sp.]|jgi:hypothetical protein|nr:hypothetical protein [Treponema sp.]
MNKVTYTVNGNEFIIEDYNNAKAFASFLPAIAGLWGKPLWVYYVNRGQSISNFGVKDKDGAVLEFTAANKAWRLTSSQGFRTFYKVNGSFYEPFRNSPELKARQTMYIKPHYVRLVDHNEEASIETEVLFCTVPGESFPALLRRLTIKNISSNELKIDCLDGLPMLHPAGTRNWMLKNLSRLAEGWFAGVNFTPNGIPYYKLPVEALDRPEIVPLYETHFYCGVVKGNASSLMYCIDPDTVFGEQMDFAFPAEFLKQGSTFNISTKFSGKNKTPSSFGYFSLSLPSGKEAVYYSMVGHCSNYIDVDSAASLLKDGFFEAKEKENEELLNSIASCAYTESAYKQFDNYCAQNYIDNALRGGFPVTIGENTIYYAYSRVHGDMEREYNNFVVLDEYFSQGNGNYRDVNQNRRNDIFFNINVGDENIHFFMNLIQSDGFNPLKVLGVRFIFESEENKQKFLDDFSRNAKDARQSGFEEKLSAYINLPFTIGGLFNFIEDNNTILSGRQALLSSLLTNAKKISLAEHGEGFWSDHWHYNTDLIENYLAIFPDRLKELLLDRRDYTFYDDHYFVQPRISKYVLFRGLPRQIRAVSHDPEKASLISSREKNPNAVRTNYGTGEIYYTNLLGKLMCLIANKYASFDPDCVGIEMETDKPNWCDAINGLPGLFGSSSAETLELLRLISFLNSSLPIIPPDTSVPLAEEVSAFLDELTRITKTASSTLEFWDKTHTVKENFREKTRLGLSGADENRTIENICQTLSVFEHKLLQSRERLQAISADGIVPTYFEYIPESYKIDENAEHSAKAVVPIEHEIATLKIIAEEKNPPIIIQSFKRKNLPLFLEGPVHYLRLCPGLRVAKEFHRRMLVSPLYDQKLRMFKTNASLTDAGHDIGRITVFTAGWLENESIWLHMEYKYLLELLRNDLAQEFFNIAETALIPFLDPSVYGRSIFENSSFLASSAHPEEEIHGRGFVARLSGATAEFISMWIAITSGLKPFSMSGGELCFTLKPSLRADFFTEANTFTFNLMGGCTVVYHNDSRKDTFGQEGAAVKSYRIIFDDGAVEETAGSFIQGKNAHAIRDRKVKRIDVNLD